MVECFYKFNGAQNGLHRGGVLASAVADAGAPIKTAPPPATPGAASCASCKKVKAKIACVPQAGQVSQDQPAASDAAESFPALEVSSQSAAHVTRRKKVASCAVQRRPAIAPQRNPPDTTLAHPVLTGSGAGVGVLRPRQRRKLRWSVSFR
jgi:hypothetical protein